MIFLDLTKHELYKIFSRKIILITLFFFAILIVLSSLVTKTDSFGDYKVFYSEYKEFKGPVTQQKLETAKKWLKNDEKNINYSNNGGAVKINYERQRKYAIYRDVLNTQERVINRDNLLKGLESNLKSTGFGGYEYNVLMLKYDMYKKLPMPGTYLWGYFGTSDLIDFVKVTGFIFFGVMILLGISPIFSNEYSTKMDSIILSTKNGKSKIITAKIISLVIFTILTGMFFETVNILTLAYEKGIFTYAISELHDPLQSIFIYAMSPYNFSILEYYLIQTLMFIFGGIILGIMVLFISSLTKSMMKVFLIRRVMLEIFLH